MKLLGWENAGGLVIESLPTWLEVSFPAQLVKSAQPLLPLTFRQKGVSPDSTPVTLLFLVSSEGVEEIVRVAVQPEAQVIFQLEAPEEVIALPDRSQRIPVRVRNKGNAVGMVSFTFSGLEASASKAEVAPGAEETVYITIPPLEQGVKDLQLTLQSGQQLITRTIRIASLNRTPASGFGLATRVETQGQLALTGEGSGKTTRSTEGNLSRFTYMKAQVSEASSQEGPKATATLRYRDTQLELQEGSQLSPAEGIGPGLYLTQSFRDLPVVETLSMGIALPTEDASSTARFGAGLNGRYLQAGFSLNTLGSDPLFRLRGAAERFTASFLYSPERPTLWEAHTSYVDAPFSLGLGADQRGSDLRFWVEPRLVQQVPQLGRLDFGVRAELLNGSFSSVSAKVSGQHGSLSWKRDRFVNLLEGSYTLQLDPVQLKMGGGLTLSGAGPSYLALDSTLPVGPALLNAGSTVSTVGTTDLRLGASYTALLPSGQLTTSGAAEVYDLFHASRTVSEFVLVYADLGGWQAQFSASIPFADPGAMTLKLSFFQQQFIPTSREFAELVDGPDPTLRSLLVQFDDGTIIRPLEGVQISGCGAPAVTDAEGIATLSGPSGACTAVVDEQSLPLEGFVVSNRVEIAPGESAAVTVLATAQVSGRVQYTDSETGEAAEGPNRTVRVTLEGPEPRWLDVALPGGTFEFGRLPIGAYVALADGGEPIAFTVDSAGTELLLTLPGSRRTVLDPATITPPLKISVDSLVVTAGAEAKLRVTSPADIGSITTEAFGIAIIVERTGQAGAESWEIVVPVPESASGTLPVLITVQFAEGAVARRVVQLIVTPLPGS